MTPTDFPTMFANISDRYAQNLEGALGKIAGFQAEGVLIKAEFADVKYHISNAIDAAWKKVIGDGFRWNGAMSTLSEKEQDLAWSLGHPYPHLVAGYLKKAKAFKGESAMRDAMVALLEEMLPLAQALDALKPLIGKRAPRPSKTSIAREERDAKAMTCQCCQRRILAETGEIAHHGYQRPGSGWQTASCYGAKSLPWEVSRERLGAMLKMLRTSKVVAEKALIDTEAETHALTWAFADETTRPNAWSKAQTARHMVTRETFEAVFEATKAIRRAQHPEVTYDRLKAAKLRNIRHEIETLAGEIAYHQPRYDGWVQTHERRDAAWVKLGA
ncbi:hypothetical protein MARCHEWKA_04250 [Brevundimonas phage vB_BpoS-Marchewka]|uniref:Uncharacterized protein n=1 Tax=Brevundimonas phage vB_BpoS-Marchewka TaxID=2948604 RepID=A0A9E7N5I6_9CAUD|nr:hypothetical protein MARCHEWKA_04250 [Brevundimonas phage vB_BpoS-Marchewka]